MAGVIRKLFPPGQAQAVVVAGLTVAIVSILREISLAALIFSGPLHSHLAVAVGMALSSALIFRVVIGFGSGNPQAFGSMQDSSNSLLALGAAGMLAAAVVVFVVKYSRVNIVKQHLKCSNWHSNVERSPAEREVLRSRGESACILRLQGYLFFGTAHGLLQYISNIIRKAEKPLSHLLLDFQHVTGMDSSASASFTRLRRLAERSNVSLIYASLPENLQPFCLASEPGDARDVCVYADLEHGVEHVEEELLVDRRDGNRAVAVRDRFAAIFRDESHVDRLIGRMREKTLDAGETLVRQGESSLELIYLESGRLTAELEVGGARTLRLRTFLPGAMVGEIRWYLGTARSANLVAEEPTVVYLLSRESMEGMEADDPAGVIEFHRWIACLLAERVAETNATMQVLQE